jgi:hypothetical protein
MSKTKVTAEQLEASAWAAALATPAIEDTVPPGWLTSRELGAKLGKAGSTIGTLLARAVREGRAERQEFRIRTGSVTRPVPHYRLLK